MGPRGRLSRYLKPGMQIHHCQLQQLEKRRLRDDHARLDRPCLQNSLDNSLPSLLLRPPLDLGPSAAFLFLKLENAGLFVVARVRRSLG